MIAHIGKYINSPDFEVILHAAPGQTGVFRWKVSASPNEPGLPIAKGSDLEEYRISTIKAPDFLWGHNGCYIFCEVTLNNGCKYTTDRVRLYDSFEKITRKNKFSTISWYDDNGEILYQYQAPEYRPINKVF